MERRDIVGYKFYDGYYADLLGRRVLRNDLPLTQSLTGKEFDVLLYFLQNPRKVIERAKILPLHTEGWRDRHPADDYVSKIKNKLGLARRECLSLVRGVGYELNADVHPVFAFDQDRVGLLYYASLKHFDQHTVASMRIALGQTLTLINTSTNAPPGAYISAAYTYINLSHAAFSAEFPAVAIPKARALVQQALTKEAAFSEAHGVSGLISLIYNYDWTALAPWGETTS